MAARWGTAYRRSLDPVGGYHRPQGSPVPNPQLPGWTWDFCWPWLGKAGREGGRNQAASSPCAGDGGEPPCSWKQKQHLSICLHCASVTLSFPICDSSHNHRTGLPTTLHPVSWHLSSLMVTGIPILMTSALSEAIHCHCLATWDTN